jgi:hypothetical protein
MEHKPGYVVATWPASKNYYTGRVYGRPASYKHGLSKTHPQLYGVWLEMRRRCTNTKAQNYRNYGGRGISISSVWSNPVVFVEWALANGWAPGLHLDRINNNGNYEPANCRFITPTMNNLNRPTPQQNRRDFLAATWLSLPC